MKALLFVSLVGLCLSNTEKPESNEYTDADVDNILVQEQANYFAIYLAGDDTRGCSDYVLQEVTKAKHKK
ncbi:hypothetical protein CHS0354_003249 [Potamilus streckersoni]|uniref:Secreted protein n=1 Tax=Potamilus streckersoni TaxID=2493646 RepID=A0AAE0SVB2_9BIVA|nr:hypothetical protein CHS0354_003249 [Potamilus streckersoni]